MYCVYIAKDKNDVPIYVGKGKKLSRGNHCKKRWECVIELYEWFDSEKDAFETEKFLIQKYGRIDKGTGTLYNKTKGGEGIRDCAAWLGKKLSAEHREKIGLKSKGRRCLKRFGINNPFYGKQHTQKTKNIMAKRKRERKWYYDPITKISIQCIPGTEPNNYIHGRYIFPGQMSKFHEYKYYHNPITGKNIRCKEGDEPLGFIKGRKVN